MLKKLKPKAQAALDEIPLGKTFTIAEDAYMPDETIETPTTAELAPVAPPAIKFTIRETIVHGEKIFHPGQEKELLDASLPIATLRALFESGALCGQYPGMAPIEKNPESFTQKMGN